MPRKLRIQYPGAIYHVMNRGDRREAIFKDDRERGQSQLLTPTRLLDRMPATGSNHIFVIPT